MLDKVIGKLTVYFSAAKRITATLSLIWNSRNIQKSNWNRN